MPTRDLRDGILESSRVEQLGWQAEVFYRRLMSVVDDYGLFDARSAVLRAKLFPLRLDRVREADISRWIAECEKAGLIALYEQDGKQLLHMFDTRWNPRSKPKYPPPVNICKQLKTPVSSRVEETSKRKDEESKNRGKGVQGENQPDLPPGFPATDNQAVAAIMEPIPPDFIRRCWDKAMGRGGCDARDVPIRRWQHHVKTEWNYHQDSQNRHGANGSKIDRPLYASELKSIIQIKEEEAKSIRNRCASEVATGLQWETQEDRERYREIMGKVKELKAKLGAMA